MLVVGAGEVGHEKLHFILKSSPNARIDIVAPWISDPVQELADKYEGQINIDQREFAYEDVIGHDLIIGATNIRDVNLQVYKAAKDHNKIVNIADTPELCDFYMCSIVTRGDVKVGISTNGKSPTFAKRFRQLLEEILPDETNVLVNNLKVIRDRLKGDFDYKVKELNRITQSLVDDPA